MQMGMEAQDAEGASRTQTGKYRKKKRTRASSGAHTHRRRERATPTEMSKSAEPGQRKVRKEGGKARSRRARVSKRANKKKNGCVAEVAVLVVVEFRGTSSGKSQADESLQGPTERGERGEKRSKPKKRKKRSKDKQWMLAEAVVVVVHRRGEGGGKRNACAYVKVYTCTCAYGLATSCRTTTKRPISTHTTSRNIQAHRARAMERRRRSRAERHKRGGRV